VLNLSSGSAHGMAPPEDGLLKEAGRTEPASLYAISKRASEQVLTRMAELWRLDALSVRLSAVFGPWERATGARDTLSPQCQVMLAAARGEAATLPRAGSRDWIYAPDVAAAVLVLLRAGTLRHRLYNITQPRAWTVLEWGQLVARHRPGMQCRLAAPGETPSVSLHGDYDRPDLDPARLRDEFGWQGEWDMARTAEHLPGWWRANA
jgi:UDP-glucose 4-epimerase